MGKDQESLTESRQIRQYLVNNWGRIPSSIWKVNWSVKVNDLSRSYNDWQKEQAGKVGKEFSLSSAGHGKEGGLSRFPQDLCQFLIKFYTKELDTVLDPFTGHNSRMESCYRCNRSYIGFDISTQFIEWNEQVKQRLLTENKQSIAPRNATITLHLQDSRNMLEQVQSESIDFCITSPPFYDLKYYGDEPEQLGRARLYSDFIYSLGKIAHSCFTALKRGKYIAWEVNDFRRDGIFHLYHADVIRMFQQVGFTIHDVIIVDYGASFLSSFLSDVEHNKIMPKQHSYIIIGYKPIIARQPTRVDTRERLLNESQQMVYSPDTKQEKLF